ncbi:hypothetical protein BJG93_03230 [Paraburkholderia sprentiae WSM5005]|uniref:Calcineurin-like phosphoesterase domain-containing protein n=1 Tax=Paraburkholderia sprentiae WSM5005 TaxID=754502 RepID=A0A1I9YDY4_9BURK|nr:hypothetical protein [Paraburkholderia sprentiae]APA84517.2 hypothetical protein BJG93_03230 [Paraburkholderia sprentiae WSM5005]
MRITDARRHPQRLRELRAALRHVHASIGGIVVLAAVCAWTAPAHAEASRFAFAVLSDTMHSSADEAATQRLLDAIARERDVRFIVYDGNLKGPKEVCRDALFERRHALLDSSRTALFFIPGQHDWVDCGNAEAGGFDPVERLDQLRQTLFADPTSMGQNPIALTRESEVSRFRPFRENVRWVINDKANNKAGDVVFIGLNAPGPNNHYLSAGGRNGEFEDRVIANAFWLEHAAEYAKRRDARAIVVFIQGDFDPERYERPERFAWLHFAHSARRDGFLEFKRSLVKLAQTFPGPVVVIHADDERPAGGFVIDQPLRNDKGMVVTNLTRIALAPRDRLNQWIQIEADFGRKPPFRVSVRDVPKQMLLPATPPVLPREESGTSMPGAPEMPNVEGFGPASELPPALQTPGESQDQQPRIPSDQGGANYGPAISMPPGSILPASPAMPASAPSVPATTPRVPASSVQGRF